MKRFGWAGFIRHAVAHELFNPKPGTAANSGAPTASLDVVGPTDQWILERLARRLVQKLPYATFREWEPRRGGATGLVYYVNYALDRGPTQFVDVGFFTHRDDSQGFLERAWELDFSVCMSKIYADWLRSQSVSTVVHIPTGFDAYRYRPQLVLGVVGLLEHPRKGKHLVDLIRSLPFVEVRVTDGRIADGQLRDFYQGVDYVLIPATVEGGPLSLLEGLGIGKPIIAPDSVGMVPEFPESTVIRRYPTGDGDALVRLVELCYREKCRGYELVRNRTWDDWAEAHDHLFRRLLNERGIPFPEPKDGFRFRMMAELDIPPRVDVTRLEETIDRAAAQLYFGRYAQARSVLNKALHEFPFAEKLMPTFPTS